MGTDAVVHVIDDDEAVRESLTFLLKTAGHPVRTYENATAFLRDDPKGKAGCVITDVRMPDISGLDLLRRLQELNVSLPVIVITGHGDVPLAVEAMKSGALDFLEKPFDDEAMLNAVSVALRHQGADAKREADRPGIPSGAEAMHNAVGGALRHRGAGAKGEADRAGILEKLASLSNRERQVLE